MRFLFALLALAFVGVVDASTLNVQVFKDRPPVTYQAAFAPVLAKQNVTFDTITSVQSTAFPYLATLVRVQCDATCHVEVGGTNPTATLVSLRLTAGQTEYFTVAAGDKLAVLGE